MSDVNQGDIGDCWFLSSLSEVAYQDPALIQSMVTDNGNGTYGVRFYENGSPVYVTVNNDVANNGQGFNASPYLWSDVVETAFAELQQQDPISGGGSNENSFASIGEGGYPNEALDAIVGATSIETFVAPKSALLGLWLESSGGGASFVSSSAALADLVSGLMSGDDLVLSSTTNTTTTTPGGALAAELVGGHALAIYGYDASTGELEIRNPWGSNPAGDPPGYDPQVFQPYFEESLSYLLGQGDSITMDNAGALPVGNASVATAASFQASNRTATFSVSDTVANIEGSIGTLNADTKLSSVTVTNPTGADTLDLTGLNAAATVDMGGNGDSAILFDFFGLSGLCLGSGYDSVTLGSQRSTVNYAGGVETVANFQTASDFLSMTLSSGASLDQTLVNGGDWITSSADMTHGVFLSGVTNKLQAVSLGNNTVVV
jgi:hypothetical protein